MRRCCEVPPHEKHFGEVPYAEQEEKKPGDPGTEEASGSLADGRPGAAGAEVGGFCKRKQGGRRRPAFAPASREYEGHVHLAITRIYWLRINRRHHRGREVVEESARKGNGDSSEVWKHETHELTIELTMTSSSKKRWKDGCNGGRSRHK